MSGATNFILGLVAAFATAGPAQAKPPSIAEFLASPTIHAMDMSPSGDRLAVVDEPITDGTVIIYDLADPSAPPHNLNLKTGFPVSVTWASDDRLLITMIDTSQGFARLRLMSAAPDGSDALLLLEDEADLKQRNHNLAAIADTMVNDERSILMPLYRTTTLNLYKVDVYTGAAKLVVRGGRNTFAWATDIKGAPAARFDIASGGRAIKIFMPNESRSNWRRVAIVREDDKWDFFPVAYTQDPNVMLVAARVNETDRAAIYRYDIANAAYLEKVAEHPRVDVTGAMINPWTGAFEAAVFVEDRVSYEFVSPVLKRRMETLNAAIPDQANIAVVDSSRDGGRWLVTATAPRNPGSFHLYDDATGAVRDLGPVFPQLTPQRLSDARVIRYATRDGVELTGYLTYPDYEGPWPLVVMPHGGPEARDNYGYDMFPQFLASRGFAVFQPNFRGSGGFGGAFAAAGHREWGGRMQDDVTDGVEHLARAGLVQRDHVCIVGLSYGGYAALAGAAFTPDLYRCAVAINGVSDLGLQLDHYRDNEAFGEEGYAYAVKSIGDPDRDAAMIAARSPARHAEAITIPVFVMHGEKDELVPVAHAHRMIDALEAAGGQGRLLILKEAGHTNWPPKVTAEVLRELELFIGANIF